MSDILRNIFNLHPIIINGVSYLVFKPFLDGDGRGCVGQVHEFYISSIVLVDACFIVGSAAEMNVVALAPTI